MENTQQTAETSQPAPQTDATPTGPQENAIARGTVVRLTETGAVVAFGWKTEGLVPLAEFDKVDGAPQVKPGDQFDVLVETLGEDPASTQLSKYKAEKLRVWDAVIAKCAGGGPVEGTILAKVQGGYSVDIGMHAFLPGSEADLRRVGDPESLVGISGSFAVIDLDKRRGRIVVSRKATLEKEQQARKAETLAKIKEGAVLPGTVKTLTDYGAFVDLGGVDGLIHVSQLSWGRVGHAREVLEVGDQVNVKVLKVDEKNGKIGLGLKQLQEDPWASAAQKFKKGDKVTGKVVNLTEFGAFVEVAPGVEGLVHVSEMSWTTKVKHPSDVVKKNQEIEAVVLEVDPEARRMSLGMRQLLPNPWEELAKKYPPGAKVHGKIRNITDFGMFVELPEGLDGLVHVSELTWQGKVNHPSEKYKVGDEVDAVVLSVDTETERMALSIKQLTEDPWAVVAKAHPRGSRLKGRVTRTVEFGAFVEVEPNVEGLVHISELREDRVEKVTDVVKPGDEIEVQVLEVDTDRRKISLSVKALTAVEDAEFREHLKNQPQAKTTLGDLFGDKLKKQ